MFSYADFFDKIFRDYNAKLGFHYTVLDDKIIIIGFDSIKKMYKFKRYKMCEGDMKKRQEVYDLYWYFACERQNIFIKKIINNRQIPNRWMNIWNCLKITS